MPRVKAPDVLEDCPNPFCDQKNIPISETICPKCKCVMAEVIATIDRKTNEGQKLSSFRAFKEKQERDADPDQPKDLNVEIPGSTHTRLEEFLEHAGKKQTKKRVVNQAIIEYLDRHK